MLIFIVNYLRFLLKIKDCLFFLCLYLVSCSVWENGNFQNPPPKKMSVLYNQFFGSEKKGVFGIIIPTFFMGRKNGKFKNIYCLWK